MFLNVVFMVHWIFVVYFSFYFTQKIILVGKIKKILEKNQMQEYLIFITFLTLGFSQLRKPIIEL